MSAIVTAPAACLTCTGSRQVWPCPRCCCVFCGQPTPTAPECERGCDVLEDATQKRREDR